MRVAAGATGWRSTSTQPRSRRSRPSRARSPCGTAPSSGGALDGLDPDDPWRAVAAFIGAVCLTLLRDPAALPLLLEAQRLARALGVQLLEADSLAWRGILSLLAGDVTGGVALISESTALVEEHNL